MADFQLIKEQVTIEAAAQFLGLELRQMGAAMRGPCPTCQTGGPRALVVTPSKQLFYCFSAGIGGDLISLWGHVSKCSLADAGRQIADNFGVGNSGTSAPSRTSAPVHPSQATAPQAPKAEPTASSFDPEAYAAKLQYTEEVAALGISEADAAQFQIGFAATGFHRGKVVFPIRHPSGEIAGFAGYANGEFKFPSRWLPAKVVQLKRA